MSELASKQTARGGPGYIHPRSDKYRENWDKVFGRCECKECPGKGCCKSEEKDGE